MVFDNLYNYMKTSHRLSIILSSGLILGLVVLEAPHTGRMTISPIVRHETLEEMTQNADLVVRGTVTKKLGTFRQAGPAGDDMVYTKWAFTPEVFLKGKQQPITIVTPGGQYATTIVEFEDMAKLPMNQSLVVALKGMSEHKGYFRIEGESQGAYAVDATTGVVRQLLTNETVSMESIEHSISGTQETQK